MGIFRTVGGRAWGFIIVAGLAAGWSSGAGFDWGKAILIIICGVLVRLIFVWVGGLLSAIFRRRLCQGKPCLLS